MKITEILEMDVIEMESRKVELMKMAIKKSGPMITILKNDKITCLSDCFTEIKWKLHFWYNDQLGSSCLVREE